MVSKEEKPGPEKSPPSFPSTSATAAPLQRHFYLLETFPDFYHRQNQVAPGTRASRARPAGQTPVARVEDQPRITVVVVHDGAQPCLPPAEKISVAQDREFGVQRSVRSLRLPAPAIPTRARGISTLVFSGLVADPMIGFRLRPRIRRASRLRTSPSPRPPSRSSPIAATQSEFKSKGGINAWDTKKYLNIWVCTLETGPTGRLLRLRTVSRRTLRDGWRRHPQHSLRYDGQRRGPFNLGRTATLRLDTSSTLRHIWETTEIAPVLILSTIRLPCETSNAGKPTFPHVSCGNGPNGDMFMNYMDYTDDDSMFMFESRSKLRRMHATLDGPRRAWPK